MITYLLVPNVYVGRIRYLFVQMFMYRGDYVPAFSRRLVRTARFMAFPMRPKMQINVTTLEYRNSSRLIMKRSFWVWLYISVTLEITLTFSKETGITGLQSIASVAIV